MPPRRTKKSADSEILAAPSVAALPEETPALAKKSRGRPQKVPSRNDVSAPAALSEEAPVTKKRTRKVAATTDKEDDTEIIPTAKKQRTSSKAHGNTGVGSTDASTTSARSGARKTVAKRDPLPGRDGRNEHPGKRKGVGPTARRRPSEIAVERETLRRAAEEQIRKGKEAAAFLAQMQIAQEQNDAAMEVESEQ